MSREPREPIDRLLFFVALAVVLLTWGGLAGLLWAVLEQ